MSRARRCGFTWVELLVVIVFVGLLLAVILPAIQIETDKGGRRTQCLYNLYNFGRAFDQLHATGKGQGYPGYRHPLELTPVNGATLNVAIDGFNVECGAPPRGGPYPVTWVVPTLHYMERYDLSRKWRSANFLKIYEASTVGTSADPVAKGFWLVLRCPSDPSPGGPNNTRCSYIANSGMADDPNYRTSGLPPDWRANGVFMNQYNIIGTKGDRLPIFGPSKVVSNRFISANDGTSQTLLLSESVNAGPYAQLDSTTGIPSTYDVLERENTFVWWPFDPASVPKNVRINGPLPDIANGEPAAWAARPSSNHPGGANFLFADGHARFISDDIDYQVFCLLMTPQGEKCNLPGSSSFVAPAPGNNFQYQRAAEFSDDMLGD